MYINDKIDKELLRRLWKSRIADEKRMKKGDLDDGCHFGLLFDSLFDDINETLYFSLNSDGIRVFIDPNSIWLFGFMMVVTAETTNRLQQILFVHLVEMRMQNISGSILMKHLSRQNI